MILWISWSNQYGVHNCLNIFFKLCFLWYRYILLLKYSEPNNPIIAQKFLFSSILWMNSFKFTTNDNLSWKNIDGENCNFPLESITIEPKAIILLPTFIPASISLVPISKPFKNVDLLSFITRVPTPRRYANNKTCNLYINDSDLLLCNHLFIYKAGP